MLLKEPNVANVGEARGKPSPSGRVVGNVVGNEAAEGNELRGVVNAFGLAGYDAGQLVNGP